MNIFSAQNQSRKLAGDGSQQDTVSPASRLLTVFFLCLLIFAPGLEVHASVPQPAVAGAVGEVTFVLGDAWISRPGKSPESISIGSKIAPADVIETGSSAFVHIGFVDHAKVVVRANSRLEIVRYDYIAANPADSVVKFNLIEGVARAMSGTAAKSARDKFRLNTPIAAIGVRGTDFIVKASQSSVQAQVYEGAIVIARFSSECSASALGPCSLDAMEVTGESRDIVEIKQNATRPQILQLAKNTVPEELSEAPAPMLVAEVETPGEVEVKGDDDTGIYTDSVTSLAVNSKINDSDETMVPGQPVEPPVQITEFTPDAQVGAGILTARQLVWGRYGNTVPDYDRIVVGNKLASEGRGIFLGNDFYVLFRDDTVASKLKPGLGDMNFDLSMAQAFYKVDAVRESVDVFGGSLNINLDTRKFSTTLDIFHPAFGDFQYIDNGITFENGLFNSPRGDANTTSGMISLDGSEAGYFFERQLDGGAVVEGLTLWDRQP